MENHLSEELHQLLNESLIYTADGKVADYIPGLAHADPHHLSIAVAYPDGSCHTAGEVEGQKLTLQSISKVLTLALVLMERGEGFVFQRVGKEPTGDPFNSIIKLETISPSKPLNPMINAGALAVTHMMVGSNVEERIEKLLEFLRLITGNAELTYNREIAQSEMETADLNRSLAYYLKEHDVINEDVEDLMDLYTKQCSIEVTVQDLAKIGLVFALNGQDPDTGRQVIPPRVASICKTFMVTCGMYNASGEFAICVGVPAKSGVSGGIVAAVPGRCGIGVYGPALDDKGNSVAGWKLLEKLSSKYDFSMFSKI